MRSLGTTWTIIKTPDRQDALPTHNQYILSMHLDQQRLPFRSLRETSFAIEQVYFTLF